MKHGKEITVALTLAAVATALGMSWGRILYESRAYPPLPIERLPGPHRIVDVHEHIGSSRDLNRLFRVMDEQSVARAVLVASPSQTLTGTGGMGAVAENNLAVIQMANEFPERLTSFVTLDPSDPKKLEKLRQWKARGARGLKLYSGHSSFRDRPLDDPAMMAVYQWCEEESFPITFHVNMGKWRDEFRRVLDRFPMLRINCPHFCMSSIRHRRLSDLLDKYENLFVDISFGAEEIIIEGLARLSAKIEKIRQIVLRHPDRFLFGADLVTVSRPGRTLAWMRGFFKTYRDFLEKERYTVIPSGDPARGLGLPDYLLKRIYEDNPREFLEGAGQ